MMRVIQESFALQKRFESRKIINVLTNFQECINRSQGQDVDFFDIHMDQLKG